MKLIKISQINFQSDSSRYKNTGYNVLESFRIGSYVLHLIEADQNGFQDQMLSFLNLPKKQISMERIDTDATDIDQQMNKRPFESDQPIKKTTNELINKIKEWKDSHGELCVASFNNDRLFQYERLFKKLNIPHRKITKEIGQPFSKKLDFIII